MHSPCRRSLAAVGFAALATTTMLPRPARADDAVVPDRSYRLIRDEENWAWLRDVPATDFWDPIKYMRLVPGHDDLYLTLGGEVREWVEGYENELWGQTGYPTNIYLLQRYMLHADGHLTRYLRFFVQAKSGLESFRKGGPRPIDEDEFDLNAFFGDVAFVPGATLDDPGRLVLRIGRQEMSYGSGRFIDVREAPNVRFAYDGVRLLTRPGLFRIDAFAVRPALTNPGAFDDYTDTTQAFWGAWATYDVPAILVDTYYLGHEVDSAHYERATGKELRHTLGSRVRARSEFVEGEVEAAYQFGSLGDLDLRAWTVASEVVAADRHLLLQPKLTLGGGITSGDGGAGSSSFGTFSPMFPRGTYFGLVSANGPANNIGPHAAIALSFPGSVTLTNEFWAFWRESLEDGVYNVPGFLVRPGNAQQGRYLGWQYETFVSWAASRHLTVNATVAYFGTGSFFDSSAPGKDITYAAGWAAYKF
jgi:hypothetical protein